MAYQHNWNLAFVLATTLVVAGCGEPERVTYVDPNPDSAYIDAGGGPSSEPFVTHGADDAARALAIRRLRGSLELVSVLSNTDPGRADDAIRFAIEDSFEPLEAVLALRSPENANGLRRALEGLGTLPGARVSEALPPARRLLAEAELVAVPAEARQDAGFRAAALASSISDAAMDVEAAGAADDESSRRLSYWRAYATLLDARTAGLRDVPQQTRAGIGDRLAEVLAGWFSDPNAAPDSGAVRVASNLNAIADDVLAAANVDPTTPPPDHATPEQLRSLKRRVATAIESVERGDVQEGRHQLEAAASTDLASAGTGIAAVDPAVLAALERSLVIDLPAAITAGTGASDAAAAFDEQLDEAISLVEDELELQRESG